MEDKKTSEKKHERGLDFLIETTMSELDNDTSSVIAYEEERQTRKLIMIASESICPKAVREALGSVFTNLYAEGYPSLRMSVRERDMLLDFKRQLAYHRRYADRRYYKGCDYVNFVEALAQKRVAELFATDKDSNAQVKVTADEIFANCQPLSGAAANNAVYEAFLEPGDTVMGMSLSFGGHLTHGSDVNRSGKYYNIVPYTPSSKTGRLDYDEIKELAIEHKPKMIIAGYSAYPWSVDWQKLRDVADAVSAPSARVNASVATGSLPVVPSPQADAPHPRQSNCTQSGAILMADIAHPAGLVAAGKFPSPIGYADVITFTTHKTLCGPRGAVILTTDEEKAQMIDRAVFPGEQGGPHINNIAAKAVAFKIAQAEQFRRLQERIVENAQALAKGLEERGFKLAYGGTDTHLLLIDLNATKTETGIPLTGEIATRILDLCGITCNKNTILGDEIAVDPSGVRLGTTFITQRGMGKSEMAKIADLIHRVLFNVKTFHYEGRTRLLTRGKIELEIMEGVKREVAELVECGAGCQPANGIHGSGYPHYFAPKAEATSAKSRSEATSVPSAHADASVRSAHVNASLNDMGLLRISGERAAAFLQEVCTNDVMKLELGQSTPSLLLNKDGDIIDSVLVLRLDSSHFTESKVACEDHIGLRDDKRKQQAGISPLRTEKQQAGGPPLRTEKQQAGSPPLRMEKQQAGSPPLRMEKQQAGGPPLRLEKEQTSPLLRCENYMMLTSKGNTEKAKSWLRALSDGYVIFDKDDLFAKIEGPVVIEDLKEDVDEGALQSVIDSCSKAFEGAAPPIPKSGEADDSSLFQLSKPYFIGQETTAVPLKSSDTASTKAKKGFQYIEEEGPLKKSCLYREHLKLTKERLMVPFAGWSMPVQYDSIGGEHETVRTAAGLFDISHMGVLEIKGEHAERFLDIATTNYVPRLMNGQCQYSYILNPDGDVMDDVMIYRRRPDCYMMVVNAVNAEKIKAWLDAVNSKGVIIDKVRPQIEIERSVTVRDLKDPASGEDRRAGIALQGPKSLGILQKLVHNGEERITLSKIKKFHFVETNLRCGDGRYLEVLVSRTGYTGEEIGFEIYVNPDYAPSLWNAILEAGAPLGLKPTGLGARDSTRAEAGLPLYGHELAGEHNITPTEAGYGSFVKFHKPFFIGRRPYLDRHLEREGDPRKKMEIVRFRMTERGRMVKPEDPVVNKNGQYIGVVTSCVLVGGSQIGLAYVMSNFAQRGTRIGVFVLPRGKELAAEKSKDKMELGDQALLHDKGIIVERFQSEEEEV